MRPTLLESQERHRPILDTYANEAFPQWGKRRLITSVCLQFSDMANRHVELSFSWLLLHLHGFRNLNPFSQHSERACGFRIFFFCSTSLLSLFFDGIPTTDYFVHWVSFVSLNLVCYVWLGFSSHWITFWIHFQSSV